MFQKGDRVRFLNEVGEATVVRVLGNGLVEVEDGSGLVAPYPARELVQLGKKAEPKAVPPDQTRPQPSPVQETHPHTADVPKKQESLPELALVFRSENRQAPDTGDLELFFHNGSGYHMLVNIAAKEEQGLFSLFSGEVRAGETRSIRGIRRQDVDIFGITMVDCIFFKEADYRHREAFSAMLKLKATRFVRPGGYRYIQEVGGGMAMVVAVERPAAKAQESSGGITVRMTGSTPKRKPTEPVFDIEIDLHIEMLSADHRGMTDHEMLLCQLNHADREINRGLSGGLLSITFIHGIGKGRLRDEVRNLAEEYGLRWEEAPFRKYGPGATVVFLRR